LHSGALRQNFPRVPKPFKPRDAQKFEAALHHFDGENSRDPNRETAGGASHPRELLYAHASPAGFCGFAQKPPRNCASPRAASIFAGGKFRAIHIR